MCMCVHVYIDIPIFDTYYMVLPVMCILSNRLQKYCVAYLKSALTTLVTVTWVTDTLPLN